MNHSSTESESYISIETKTIYLEIKPLDVLFFREFKPFTSGEDVFARSLSTPPLTTIRGALRAHYFRNNPSKFNKKTLNDPTKDPTYNLTIKGLYYKIINKNDNITSLYLQKPLDVVKVQNSTGEHMFQRLKLETINDDIILSVPSYIHRIFVSPSEKLVRKQPDNMLMSIDAFIEYLSSTNEFPADRFIDFSDVITEEPKIGIKISSETRTTEEEMFYYIITNRYETDKYETSFIVEVENLPDSTGLYDKEIIKIGGEGKLAEIKKCKNSREISKIKELRTFWLQNNLGSNNLFSIYLFTPTPLDYIAPLLNNSGLKLETYMMTNPALIGGYSLQKRAPKKTMKALLPGTILLFSRDNSKNNGDVTNNILQKLVFLHKEGDSLLQLNSTEAKTLEMGSENGFGRIFVGKINET